MSSESWGGNRNRTAGEETEADEHGQDVEHAEDVVHQIWCPEQQRCGNSKGGKVGKVIELRT